MASSDEEGEILPVCVTNYLLENDSGEPISFSELPLHWSDQEKLIDNRDSPVVALRGTTDEGLQSIYKEVIAWKLELSHVVPKVYMLSKGKTWIQLQQPRKSYENVIKSVLVVVRCLHFAKRNADATRDQISSHVVKSLRSYDVVEPVENYLSAHLLLIQSAMAKDTDLAKSKYLKTFLMEIENPGRREYHLEENQTKNKSKFIVPDDEEPEEETDDESDDEDELLFDAVCAYCDNGGDVLPCEGQCMRSFHPTIDAGVETNCESLGFANAAQYEAIPTFLCGNCKHQKHQCFACGMLGSSDKSSTVEVFPCVSATCGHFYHPGCVSQLLYPSDETRAKKFQSQIAAGESFTCPAHKCRFCNLGENKEVYDLQFAVCRRCPKAYHRKCLPRKIAFEASADGSIKQRAWDGLLPKRILMYCMKHAILPKLGTPKRDHLLFPRIIRKRNQEGSRIEEMTVRSEAFGNLTRSDTANIPKAVQRRCNYNTITYGDKKLEKGKSYTMQEKRSSIENNPLISRKPEKRSSVENNPPISRKPEQTPTNMQSKSAFRDNMQREKHVTSKSSKKIIVDTPPVVDTDMKTRILKIIKESTSSFDVEEFMKEKRSKCTHQIYAPHSTGVDKTITMGKVEASVKAVRTALKKLEDGGSIEDAKAVCEPNVLNQLVKWKDKLHVFLAPFLHGARYTSFGRHFTKVEKLKEIVDRLHWYVNDGDTIVDFCCGSNDFSCFMKEKLDYTGKTRCSFKNYDLIIPKNTFNFEKRDWFSVLPKDLPDGSRLIMGLNPPFGVKAALANKFINHALSFKPKLLILIVPKETKRLDEKWCPYDLIWEEEDMLSGKSFYLPGSVSVHDQPLEDWNIVSPPLSLWSRRDWTSEHRAVAEKHTHRKPNQTNQKRAAKKQKPKRNRRGERRASPNYLMEEKHDCYDDFSTIMATKYPDISNILDDVPEISDVTQPGGSKDTNMPSDTTGTRVDDPSDMDLESPFVSLSPTNSTSGPSHYQHGSTSLPYESGIGFQYAFPSHPGGITNSYYGQPDFSVQPPYANYGHPTTYPTMTSPTPQCHASNYGHHPTTYPTVTSTTPQGHTSNYAPHPTTYPTITSATPQFHTSNYGHPAATFPTMPSPTPHCYTSNYGHPHYQSEATIWPPGTLPPDRRFS